MVGALVANDVKSQPMMANLTGFPTLLEGVSERDIHSLFQQIDGNYLLAHRTGFKPAQFVRPSGKRPRQSPFRSVGIQVLTTPRS